MPLVFLRISVGTGFFITHNKSNEKNLVKTDKKSINLLWMDPPQASPSNHPSRASHSLPQYIPPISPLIPPLTDPSHPPTDEDEPLPRLPNEDNLEPEQLVDDTLCNYCYTSKYAYQCIPCMHWSCCESCMPLLVTKTFTSAVSTHTCAYCKQNIEYFFHIPSQTQITPLEMQNQFAHELQQENLVREAEYEQDIRLRFEARESEEAWNFFGQESDGDEEEATIGRDAQHRITQLAIEGMDGRLRPIFATPDWNVILRRLREPLPPRQQGPERQFMNEVNADRIEGSLDYVPSDQDEDQEDDSSTVARTHTMATRSSSITDVVEQQVAEEEESRSIMTPPLTRRRRRQQAFEAPISQRTRSRLNHQQTSLHGTLRLEDVFGNEDEDQED